MLGRIIGFIVTTFAIAVLYGLFVTAMDFMGPGYSPVNSGHRAAGNVYGLFGTVSDEIKNNSENGAPRATSVAHKIARPYAVTADLAAIVGGKLGVGIVSFFHTAENKMDRGTPVRS